MGKLSSRLLRSWYLGQPSFLYEDIEIFTKERVVRQDLGKRATMVDWARMKRPSVLN